MERSTKLRFIEEETEGSSPFRRVKSKGYEASLEIGKLYRVLPDKEAQGHGYLRIVDESGEDYGYAADRFFSIVVPLSHQAFGEIR
jgi:hypothetical protein